MSTSDVPGAKPENNDDLALGCWAEHDDGSLIYVKGFEGEDVIYEMYDRALGREIPKYTDRMPIDLFKQEFSWVPDDSASIRWTWHDKTPFDWNKVGVVDGPSYASADQQLSAAQRVAQSRNLRRQMITKEQFQHLLDQVDDAKKVFEKVQSAISQLPVR